VAEIAGCLKGVAQDGKTLIATDEHSGKDRFYLCSSVAQNGFEKFANGRRQPDRT
jgi:hypothetical protein